MLYEEMDKSLTKRLHTTDNEAPKDVPHSSEDVPSNPTTEKHVESPGERNDL